MEKFVIGFRVSVSGKLTLSSAEGVKNVEMKMHGGSPESGHYFEVTGEYDIPADAVSNIYIPSN